MFALNLKLRKVEIIKLTLSKSNVINKEKYSVLTIIGEDFGPWVSKILRLLLFFA